MADWSRKSSKKVSTFDIVCLPGNVHNSVPKRSPPPQSTRCMQISCNLVDGKSVKSCAAYLKKTNKNSPRSSALATARIALKMCHDQRQTMCSECSRFHPNRFTFGRVIAECVSSLKTHRKVFPVIGSSLASSRIKNNIDHFRSLLNDETNAQDLTVNLTSLYQQLAEVDKTYYSWRDLSMLFFQDICKPTSCLYHLFPPLRDKSVSYRLRTATRFTCPIPRTKILFFY